MTLTDTLKAIEAWPVAAAIAEGAWQFPTLESLHVVAIAVVVGSIMMMDLRLLGVTRRRASVTETAGELLPWTWTAFAGAVLTGVLMFTSRAGDYWGNPFFKAKMVLLALAFVNMLAFHLVTWRGVAAWNLGPPAPGARVAGAISLTLWVTVVACGRWIGFV